MKPLDRIRRRRMLRKSGADRFARIGPNSLVVPPAVILAPHRIELGDRVLIYANSWWSVVEEFNGRRHEPHVKIGDGTVIGRDLYISCVGDIEIGADVLTGDRLVITDTYHEYEDTETAISKQPMAEPSPVRIGDGAFLGHSVTVLHGVTIGERAFVATGAVVTSDVPANSVAVGNPARVIRRFDRERGEWVSVGDADAGA